MATVEWIRSSQAPDAAEVEPTEFAGRMNLGDKRRPENWASGCGIN